MTTSEEQLRASSHAHAWGARRVTLGAGSALVLALAAFGAATLFSQLTTSADMAMGTGVTAMHPPVGNRSGGTLPASATQEPSFDEMVKVCSEHMASMAPMMQMMQGPGMMQGMPGMGSGAR